MDQLSAGDVAAHAADALLDYVYDEEVADASTITVTDTPEVSIFVLSLANGQRFRFSVVEL
jgi:hypothetical protein